MDLGKSFLLRCRNRDSPSIPIEICGHGINKYAKSLTSYHAEKGNEHGSGNYVPAVVNGRLSGLTIVCNPREPYQVTYPKYTPIDK
jgi:hypothetical protein